MNSNTAPGFSTSTTPKKRTLPHNTDKYLKRRDQVMDAIIKYINRNHISPTIRELCEVTGINPASLLRYIHKLADEGELIYEPWHARSIRIPPQY